MKDFYYLLETISIDVPKTYIQYLDLWSFFIIILATILISIVIKKIVKQQTKCLKTLYSVIVAAGLILAGNLTLQSLQYFDKKQKFEQSKIHSDYLKNIIIYVSLKNHPYTLSESDIFKTNDPVVLANLHDKESFLGNEHRRTFNLVKNTLLNIHKNSIGRIAVIIKNPEFCTKDAINELYRCKLTLENPHGTKIYAHTLIYTNPKFYQDYLLFGLNKNTI